MAEGLQPEKVHYYHSGEPRAESTAKGALITLFSDKNLSDEQLLSRLFPILLPKKLFEKLFALLQDLSSNEGVLSDLLSQENLLYKKLSEELLVRLFPNKSELLLSEKNLLYEDLFPEKKGKPLSDDEIIEKSLYNLLIDEQLLSDLLPKELLTNQQSLSKLFYNESSSDLSSEDEELGSQGAFENIKPRIRKSLFGLHPYFGAEMRKRRDIERKEKSLPEFQFVTEFLRGGRSEYDKENGVVLCHPLTLATPYLLEIQNLFKRMNEGKNKKIDTLVAMRHGEKLGMDGGLSWNGVKQAIELGKNLRKDLDNIKENKKYNEPIYFFGHNTIFESIVMSLHFLNKLINDKGGNNSEELIKKDLANHEEILDARKDKNNFPHNDIDYMQHDKFKNDINEYINQDWTKMLEFAEPIKLNFYPSEEKNDAYMEINRRGVSEIITYSDFNKIVNSLKDSKFNLFEIGTLKTSVIKFLEENGFKEFVYFEEKNKEGKNNKKMVKHIEYRKRDKVVSLPRYTNLDKITINNMLEQAGFSKEDFDSRKRRKN